MNEDKSGIFTIEPIVGNQEKIGRSSISLDLTGKDLRTCSSLESQSGIETPSPGTPTSVDSRSILVRQHSHREAANISTGKTLIFLIKGNLGAGLFAIPAAFKDAGLVGGSIGIPFMAILSMNCMHMLVNCTQVLKTRKGDPDMAMDYSQAIESACLTGPPVLQKYAIIARRTIKISLFLKELAFCSVFILFSGTYLLQLVSYFCPGFDWTIRHWTATMSIAALAMSCITNHHYLHILSYMASSIKLFALIVLFCYVFQDLPHVSERPAFSTAVYLFLYYGTVIFAFEGVTQVLPLHDNMRTTRHFRGWNGVLNTGMILIGCLYFMLGFYGYLKYGEKTYPSITMNLPKDETICQVVKIGLIIALMINYANQLNAAVELTEPTINMCASSPRQAKLALVVVRACCFCASVSVALITENLDLFMSLAGALFCTLVCLIFPPTLDTITFWHKISWYRLTKNIFIILLGVFAFVIGVGAAVMALGDYFQELQQHGAVRSDI